MADSDLTVSMQETESYRRTTNHHEEGEMNRLSAKDAELKSESKVERHRMYFYDDEESCVGNELPGEDGFRHRLTHQAELGSYEWIERPGADLQQKFRIHQQGGTGIIGSCTGNVGTKRSAVGCFAVSSIAADLSFLTRELLPEGLRGQSLHVILPEDPCG